jgi:hypothetical protein
LNLTAVAGGGEAATAAAAGGEGEGKEQEKEEGGVIGGGGEETERVPDAVKATAEALVEELELEPETVDGRYKLTGVVIHQGSSPHLGHYYSYVLCPEEGRWYCVNDASVSAFPLRSVEKVWFQGGHASPFLLFYERVEEEREEAGRDEEGQAVAIPSMGLPSVALVLDLLRHLTLTALATVTGDNGQRRRVMNLVGRVLPWAMGLGQRYVRHFFTHSVIQAFSKSVSQSAFGGGGI